MSASARISDIPVLPVFFKLAGRAVLIAGGTAPAAWKAELLAAAGARVTVCDPDPCREIEDLARSRPEAVRLVRRGWTPDDLADKALGVGALDEPAAEAFRAAARAAGIPVNIVDIPHLCDFQFGTILDRAPLLIAISTTGAAPVLGQALRARIEGLLPACIGAWAEAARVWRPEVAALGFAGRRRFWECFADRALDANHLPTEEDRQACRAAALGAEAEPRGRLWLVGAGPGAADLVTLRAVRALQAAEIIVHDAALAPEILRLGRREAERRAEAADDTETAILIASLLAEGRAVTWIALGDPETCPCWSRRRAAAAPLSPTEIVPGVACGSRCPGP